MSLRRPPSVQQHADFSGIIHDLRLRIETLLMHKLNRRTTAPILDAALRIEHNLQTLVIRLMDELGDNGASVYHVDPPTAPAARRSREKLLSVDEYRQVGAELYKMRGAVQTLSAGLATHWCKTSPVGQAARKLERDIDRLRCRLDAMFCKQHPDAFDSHVYYPGPRAAEQTALTNATGLNG